MPICISVHLGLLKKLNLFCVTAFFGFFLALVEWRFYRGFLRKVVVSCWFFVVKLWWIAGADVVFGW